MIRNILIKLRNIPNTLLYNFYLLLKTLSIFLTYLKWCTIVHPNLATANFIFLKELSMDTLLGCAATFVLSICTHLAKRVLFVSTQHFAFCIWILCNVWICNVRMDLLWLLHHNSAEKFGFQNKICILWELMEHIFLQFTTERSKMDF